MRITLKKILVMVMAELFFMHSVMMPSYAFVSTTGYVRVASVVSMNALTVAQRGVQLQALSTTLALSNGSIALRLVTGPVGWASLGITAGLAVAQVYYNSQQAAAIKAAAAPPGPITVPGLPSAYDPYAKTLGTCPGSTGCVAGDDQIVEYTISNYPNNACLTPPGWVFRTQFGSVPVVTCRIAHSSGGSPTTRATQAAGSPATEPQISTYVNNLPANDPNSMQSNTTAVGANQSPTPGDNQSSIQIAPTDLPSTVVPASSVQPNDTVLNPNATPPTGTQTTQTQDPQTTTGTSTTTTTSTTNPDGSVTTTQTKTETEGAISSCSAGVHDERSFGTVLQEHISRWQGSGLLSALNVLKTLTWPTALPTYALSSSIFGSLTLDFSAWGGVLTALRSVIIAMASFVAYRIVFVGSK